MSDGRERVTIIGGGLAGCRAAWQLARAGVGTDLYEMRPSAGPRRTPPTSWASWCARTPSRNATLQTAVGLLKEEMRQLSSLVMRVADRHQVPAGSCLAVDRRRFAAPG
jgi:methylenetetrahydrofolate--tRNA-(uracil-5-)-methyltransferase